jgi:DNA-3-methyladenine glycosylase
VDRTCGQKLLRDFFDRSALEVARDLVGKCLVHRSPEGVTSGTIVETEAYGGIEDPASHAYGGRRTARNGALWGPPGHTYVYPIYGMYLCLNIVANAEGVPQGVLIRALSPLQGLDLMAGRRGFDHAGPAIMRKLTTGPSKLCVAMGITREMNGMDVTGDELFLTEGPIAGAIIATPRVGIDYAGEGRQWPWRFALAGNEYVSKPQALGRRRT